VSLDGHREITDEELDRSAGERLAMRADPGFEPDPEPDGWAESRLHASIGAWPTEAGPQQSTLRRDQSTARKCKR
jgi:hypothetical protein